MSILFSINKKDNVLFVQKLMSLVNVNSKLENILFFIENVDSEIRTYIIHLFYRLHNIDIIYKQKHKKHLLNNYIQESIYSYKLQTPKTINISKFFTLFNNIDQYTNVIRYLIRLNKNNAIFEILNLEAYDTTLVQFTFFVKTLLKFLSSDICILIHPTEIKQLFLQTPLRTFRTLYLLYEARDQYIRKEKFNEDSYRSYIVEYMRKKGHDIVTFRIGEHLFQFPEN